MNPSLYIIKKKKNVTYFENLTVRLLVFYVLNTHIKFHVNLVSIE